MRHLITLGLLLIGSNIPAAAGPARLVKDINQTLSWEMGSFPGSFHRNGDFTLFRAGTAATGVELWRTDGTEAGTWLVKDLWPGPQSGSVLSASSTAGDSPFDPAIIGHEALFIANDGVHGWELWKTDGSQAGTRLVREIRPGPQGPFDAVDEDSRPILTWTHFEFGGMVYFLANDGTHGFEIWRTDGTEAGTTMLKDIQSGPAGAFGTLYHGSFFSFDAATVGNTLYFSADDGLNGMELWKTDGTPGGTLLVTNIAGGPAGSRPNHMIDLDGVLIFWADSGLGNGFLWRSDGTEAGTFVVRNRGSFPTAVTQHNGRVVFSSNQTLYATDGTFEGTYVIKIFTGQTDFLGELDGRLLLRASDATHGSELWTTDGMGPGTLLVKDINPGASWSFPADLHFIAGRLFFTAQDALHGREPWTSDGTEAGTHLIADLEPGPGSSAVTLFEAGGRCYLSAYDTAGAGGWRLWSTDGTETGTRRLKALGFDGRDSGEAPDGSLLLSADDGQHGFELWKSDGTEGGTGLVKDINPSVVTNPSNVRLLGVASIPGTGDRAFFRADDGVHGYELWISDGSTAGTRMVKDITPGAYGSGPDNPLVHGGVLYFSADDGLHGRELWRSDGTEAGTFMVVDLFPYGQASGFWSGPVAFNGSVYFVGDDAFNDAELWKTDGTPGGTVLAAETIPGPDSSYPDRLHAAKFGLLFAAHSPYGYTLWKSDGTQSGTAPIVTSGSGSAPSSPIEFVELGDRVVFTASDQSHGREIWITDGTQTGTHLVRDIRPGTAWGLPRLFTQSGGSIYFIADDSLHGRELWKTDGTEAGTMLVKDVRPGPGSDPISSLASLDGILYFDSWMPGTSLWRTDGSEAGTVPIKSNPAGSPAGLLTVKGGLLFTSWDADHGEELWRSDGTSERTVLAQDMAPGPRNSGPEAVAEMGDRIFIVADDGFTGGELWVARTAILMNQPAQAIQDLTNEVKALGLAKGLETSLLAMLDAAARALSANRPADAITSLDVFSKQVDTLTPRWISEVSGAELRQFAGEIAGLLESAP